MSLSAAVALSSACHAKRDFWISAPVCAYGQEYASISRSPGLDSRLECSPGSLGHQRSCQHCLRSSWNLVRIRYIRQNLMLHFERSQAWVWFWFHSSWYVHTSIWLYTFDGYYWGVRCHSHARSRCSPCRRTLSSQWDLNYGGRIQKKIGGHTCEHIIDLLQCSLRTKGVWNNKI